MLIDWHVHIHDIKDQVNPYWKGKCPMTPENVLAAHKLAGLDRTVISNAVHYLRFCKSFSRMGGGRNEPPPTAPAKRVLPRTCSSVLQIGAAAGSA